LPIFHSLRAIFIHIPKCAGISMTDGLSKALPAGEQAEWLGAGLWDQLASHPDGARLLKEFRSLNPLSPLATYEQPHVAGRILRELLPKSTWNDYFKFAFVRNPWDRAVSKYAYTQARLAEDHTLGNQFDEAYLMQRCPRFEDWVRLLPVLSPGGCSGFITDADGELIVDYVGRFENAKSDFAHVCKTLGIDIPLGCLNGSLRRPDYRSYYQPETRDIVARLFAEDIARFGYTF